jgi:murein DD-endopeptidase MepM/ murein hydrolase activator NlpD
MGNDLGARAGTQVLASANGVVVRAGWNGGYGNMIEIRHANGYTTRYAHLKGFARGIRAGSRVSQKQLIGYVGMTGLATAPHLHYELRYNGRAIDATRVRLPDGESLGRTQLALFRQIARARESLLDRAGETMIAHSSGKDANQRAGL